MSTSIRPRILIADDHSLVAAGLCKLLEQDFDLLSTVGDGRSLIAAALATQPDVILTDISMPILNGLDAARQVLAILPSCKIVFLTVHSEAEYVRQAFRAGASGYLLKGSAVTELTVAIREVLNNELYLTPLIDRKVLDGVFSGTGSGPALTARQREVLQHVSEGHSAKEIGSILRISPKTVELDKTNIMRKLNLHSIAQLTRYAIVNRIARN